MNGVLKSPATFATGESGIEETRRGPMDLRARSRNIRIYQWESIISPISGEVSWSRTVEKRCLFAECHNIKLLPYNIPTNKHVAESDLKGHQPQNQPVDDIFIRSGGGRKASLSIFAYSSSSQCNRYKSLRTSGFPNQVHVRNRERFTNVVHRRGTSSLGLNKA